MTQVPPRQRSAAATDDTATDDAAEGAAGAEDGGSPVLPELADPAWLHHAALVASTSFWSVARQLPLIVREAVGLAWRANRWDTVAAVGLNLAAGVMTT